MSDIDALLDTVLKVCKADPDWNLALREAVLTLQLRDAATSIEWAMEMAVRIVLEAEEGGKVG